MRKNIPFIAFIGISICACFHPQASLKPPHLTAIHQEINTAYIQDYARLKFRDYGCDVKENTAFRAKKIGYNQWVITSTDTDSLRLEVYWDGYSNAAETIFIQARGETLYKQ